MAHKPSPSLTYLGRATPAPASDEAVLDRVPNPHSDTAYVVRFSAPEFTVLCRETGQSDFAHFIID
jgi:7-cyano-7-deazaguanine reductase